jgi:threonine dehydrogenase-like Zn-dependent dehydrogenase
MRAITVVPGQPKTATVSERPDPPESDGALVCDGLLMGVCGTDQEITEQDYGWLPEGDSELILGHESLGRVTSAPAGTDFAVGDLVVGIVRRPDPVPCPWCANLEWDMCSNGQYTERGIKARHGYGSSVFRVEPDYAIKVDPKLGMTGILLEPTAVVAKVWEQVERIGHRATYAPKRVLVTGAGPIGLLAAELVRSLGATYHHDGVSELGFQPDIVIEGTGVGSLLLDCLRGLNNNGIIGLCGINSVTDDMPVPLASINKQMVLANQTIVGSVNEARRHYEQANEALASADLPWLERLVTKKVPMDTWTDALAKTHDDVKVVIDLQS